MAKEFSLDTQSWIETEEDQVLPPNASPLDFLMAVVRDDELPLSTRIRAATAALPFVHPKLGVHVTIDGRDLAERLDAAIERSRLVKLGYVPTNKMIEARPEPFKRRV